MAEDGGGQPGKNECILDAGGGVDMERLKERVESWSKTLSSQESTHKELETGSKQFYELILAVWSLDTAFAVDAAELVCNTLRVSGGLDCMLELLCTSNDCLRLQLSQGIEQVMDATNRCFIVEHGQFDVFVKVACDSSSLECIKCGTGILENLFKHSKETCLHLVECGALESVLFGCRSSDSTVLHHCAATLANCSMYGGPKCQMKMVAKSADHWLFPLAFSQDNVVKYYALLAICFLASNAELEGKVARSGTLDLVLPFLQMQDPEEFPKTCYNHAHGRSSGWLRKLVPLLVCGNEEARSLSAFHFAMETAIKKKQHRLQVFTDIDAISHLKESAKIGSELTAHLCCQALLTCDAVLPHYQCWNVLSWVPAQVSAWVGDIGLTNHAPAFTEQLVTGNLLLDLTLEDLKELGFSGRLQGRWFLQEVRRLRCLADISRQDHGYIGKWLTGVCKNLAVYKVDFIRNGISRSLLPHLTDDLLQELGISQSVDRLKLLLAVKAVSQSTATDDMPDCQPLLTQKQRYDVFISYRRANGSQLASLLKVHLQLRGISVFLDVEELGSGKFDEAILSTISQSRNLLLVLSPGALDRCRGDTSVQDWVHREVLCALEHQVQLTPILSAEFRWPKQSELPEDLQQVCILNGVTWSHEYQDACVEKLISFLHLPRSLHSKGRHSTSSS